MRRRYSFLHLVLLCLISFLIYDYFFSVFCPKTRTQSNIVKVSSKSSPNFDEIDEFQYNTITQTNTGRRMHIALSPNMDRCPPLTALKDPTTEILNYDLSKVCMSEHSYIGSNCSKHLQYFFLDALPEEYDFPIGYGISSWLFLFF